MKFQSVRHFLAVGLRIIRLPSVSLSASALFCLLLTACVGGAPVGDASSENLSSQQVDNGSDAATAADELIVTQTGEVDNHSTNPEFIYNYLAAQIARQRRDFSTAHDSMKKAAELSGDYRVVGEAIRLAHQVNDYESAIELSKLLGTIQPDNHLAVLSEASALFRSGRSDDALAVLVDLSVAQDVGDESVLQEVAIMVARQEREGVEGLLDSIESKAADAGDSHQLWMLAALTASRSERMDRFKSSINKSLQALPSWETAAILKLTHLSEDDLRDDFVAFAQNHIESFPEHHRFTVQYARLLVGGDDLDNAIRYLQQVLEADPGNLDASYTAALVYLELEQIDDARPLLENYLAAVPDNDQVKIYLADIFRDQQEFEEASRLLRQIRSEQFYLDAQIALSRVIALQSDVEAGARYMRRIDAQNEEQAVRLILAQDILFRDFDRLDRSKEILDEAIDRMPDQPRLLYNRGLLAAQMNLLEIHEADMRSVIELQPENAHAYNALGYTLADQTNRFDEALDLIVQALELAPDDPFILDSMGWIQYRIGNNTDAIDYLERAIDNRKDAEIAAHLGEVLWVEDRKSEARTIWSQGLEWDPKNKTLIDTMDRFLASDSAI
ncbi:MAG: tetratricopeptide repeat protein [Pseudomonadota bacterium]